MATAVKNIQIYKIFAHTILITVLTEHKLWSYSFMYIIYVKELNTDVCHMCTCCTCTHKHTHI